MDDYEHRVIALEIWLDSVLPTLATKADLAEVKSDIIKWVVGTAVAISLAAITVMTFVLNNAIPKAASSPVVINVPR